MEAEDISPDGEATAVADDGKDTTEALPTSTSLLLNNQDDVVDIEEVAVVEQQELINEEELQQQQQQQQQRAIAVVGCRARRSFDDEQRTIAFLEPGSHANEANNVLVPEAHIVSDENIRNEIMHEIVDEMRAITHAEEILAESDARKWCKWTCGFIAAIALASVIIAVAVTVAVPRDSSSTATLPPDTETMTPEPSRLSCIQTTDELRSVVDQYLLDNQSDTKVALEYGWPIGTWCVSSIQDFSGLFSLFRNYETIQFNEDISSWDTSSAVNMSRMFEGSVGLFHYFNRDLSSWNVSSVTDMSEMFAFAVVFNQNVSSWDVSSVTDMNGMFVAAVSFNQRLSSWDVSRVTNMAGMLGAAKVFNQNLFDWDVSSVTNMTRMFQGATAFNQDLSSWNVSSVTDMSWMFGGLDSSISILFNEDLLTFDSISFNQDLSSWDVSGVTDMSGMFEGAGAFDQDLCVWGSKLSKTTFVTDMFKNTSCPDQRDPVLSSIPPGPFCYSCN